MLVDEVFESVGLADELFDLRVDACLDQAVFHVQLRKNFVDLLHISSIGFTAGIVFYLSFVLEVTALQLIPHHLDSHLFL